MDDGWGKGEGALVKILAYDKQYRLRLFIGRYYWVTFGRSWAKIYMLAKQTIFSILAHIYTMFALFDDRKTMGQREIYFWSCPASFIKCILNQKHNIISSKLFFLIPQPLLTLKALKCMLSQGLSLIQHSRKHLAYLYADSACSFKHAFPNSHQNKNCLKHTFQMAVYVDGGKGCPIYNLVVIDKMLGDDLHQRRQLEVSKSSFLSEDADERRLREIIQEREKTIRLLSKKIDRLEANNKRAAAARYATEEVRRGKEDPYMELLKAEVEKSRRLEEIVQGMSSRIGQLLGELAQDHSLTDASEDFRILLQQLELPNSLSVSFDDQEQSFASVLSLSHDWTKIIDVLEVALKSCREQALAAQREVVSLSDKLTAADRTIAQLQSRRNPEEVSQLKAEVREERKQRQKLRGLLEKTEVEKNELINRINTIGLRDPQVKAKTKEELVQYSKELNYRIRDLQKEKEDILKTTNRQQQVQLKKYQDMLRQLRTIKEVSRMGKSCA